MADITATGNGKNRKHLRRLQKPAPRVDMTPMVDLGFLLITFFMLSMQLSKPMAMKWEKQVADIHQQPVPACCVLNILIDSADRIYTYEGEDIKQVQATTFSRTNGIRKVITKNRERVKAACGVTLTNKKRDLICLIKMLPGARYKNLTDVVDEMNITHSVYSIQEPLAPEIEVLKIKKQELLAAK